MVKNMNGLKKFAEEFNKKHMMKLVEIYARRGYEITE